MTPVNPEPPPRRVPPLDTSETTLANPSVSQGNRSTVPMSAPLPSTQIPTWPVPTIADLQVTIDQSVWQAVFHLALVDKRFPVCGYLGGQLRVASSPPTAAERPVTTYYVQYFYPSERTLRSLLLGFPEEDSTASAKAQAYFASVGARCVGTYHGWFRHSTLLEPDLVDTLKRAHSRVPQGIHMVVSPGQLTFSQPFAVHNVCSVYYLIPNETTRAKRKVPVTATTPTAAETKTGSQQNRTTPNGPLLPITPANTGSANPTVTRRGSQLPLSSVNKLKSAMLTIASIVYVSVNPQPHVTPAVLSQTVFAMQVILDELRRAYTLKLQTVDDPIRQISTHADFETHLNQWLTQTVASCSRWVEQEYRQLATARLFIKTQVAERLSKLGEKWTEARTLANSGDLEHPTGEAVLEEGDQFFQRITQAYRDYQAAPTSLSPKEAFWDRLDERVYWLDSVTPLDPIKVFASQSQHRLKRLDTLLATQFPEKRRRKGGTSGSAGTTATSSTGRARYAPVAHQQTPSVGSGKKTSGPGRPTRRVSNPTVPTQSGPSRSTLRNEDPLSTLSDSTAGLSQTSQVVSVPLDLPTTEPPIAKSVSISSPALPPMTTGRPSLSLTVHHTRDSQLAVTSRKFSHPTMPVDAPGPSPAHPTSGQSLPSAEMSTPGQTTPLVGSGKASPLPLPGTESPWSKAIPLSLPSNSFPVGPPARPTLPPMGFFECESPTTTGTDADVTTSTTTREISPLLPSLIPSVGTVTGEPGKIHGPDVMSHEESPSTLSVLNAGLHPNGREVKSPNVDRP
ncbi:hypothetical protein IWQ62_003017 [Dispira parvispora]|uniref:Uncharacterized protein n=1 Tax=Dispira parvispora TaxID=1520584 RepID=A0A9W8E6N2_9FUNG|nr:hypothetical protein IWQ62_003017 [Dispira parvispora]